MSKRVDDKVAIVMGGGQTPGEDIGNGRAAAVILAGEGAKVVVADLNLESAEETAEMIRSEGREATAAGTDATDEAAVKDLIGETVSRYGRLDILHNNVGAGALLPGDA